MTTRGQSISFDDEVLHDAKILSKKEGRSLSNYITQAVREYNTITKTKTPQRRLRRAK